MAQKIALDLLRAETWRASWQLGAAAILNNTHTWQFRRSVLGPMVARVCDGFASESRLKGIVLTQEVPDWNLSAVIDEDAVICALTGAIIATAGLTEGAGAPVITVAGGRSDDGQLTIDIAQDLVAPAADIESRFFDPRWSDRPGGWPATIGAAMAKAVTQRHRGDALLLARDERGSTLRLTLG